ncbi:hypothetical protein [uncultured Sulfitobacter sp.]|uniref:hypothetical protein n=1 Tax=uncultured Sulfitobacter sp. TaxID=191468 RepID=UPI0030F63355
MTEYFKQIVDAWGDRLRSPVLGSILIFFVATNWQSVFYLFFADKPVRARLLYFDANTDGWSLYVIPLLGGVVLAVAIPWITVAGAQLAKFPQARLHALQSSEALKRRIVEHGLKAQEEEARERRKIDAAKRLDEAENMSAELKSEIEADRAAHEAPTRLSTTELRILDFAANSSDGLVFLKGNSMSRTVGEHRRDSEGFSSHREQKLFEDSFETLIASGRLEHRRSTDGGALYEITAIGYEDLKASKNE